MQDQIEQLESAIESLEAQRAILGDDVVETTVATLRERLQALEALAQQEQRKQMTVLFADLSGYTAMAEAMDAEEVRDTINALWERLDTIIAANGGRVDKHMGDGLMALFGVPVAREDDPERAVTAALEMQNALQAFNSESDGPALAMRIGINSGPALFGPVGGSDEFTAMGDSVNIAARLEENAPLGGILISQAVYSQVQGRFQAKEVTLGQMRGRREIVTAYQVMRLLPRGVRSAGRGVEGVETRMVGRGRELSMLKKLWQIVQAQGAGRAVLVVGDAGIGKTRLRQEFRTWLTAHLDGGVLLEGRADQQLRRRPYALLRDLTANYCDIQDSDSAATAREKLEAKLKEALGDSAAAQRQIHFIGHLIGFDYSKSPHLRGMLDNARQIPQQMRRQAFRHLLHTLRTIAEAQPVAILLEDIHWADEGSLDLLEELLDEVEQAPFLLVCLSRPSLFQRRQGWRGEGGAYTLLPLSPLTVEDSRQLVTEILHLVSDIPAYLLDRVTAAADGNPFYVEELIKVLIADGAIEKGAKEWRVRSSQTELRVPVTLTGVLQARLDRLPLRERETLQRAAVVGRVFWDSAVAAAGTASGEDLQPLLQALVEKEFVYRRDRSVFTGSDEYAFKHALLQQVTYEGVLLRLRRRYHARVGNWLAEQYGERGAEYAGLIAEHYELAGHREEASEWYGVAGQQARDSYAPETAIRLFRKALDHMPTADPEREIMLYGGLGEMLRWQARFAEAVEALHAMLQAAEQVGDLEAQALAWKGLFLAQDYQGEHRAALHSAEGAERVALAAGSKADLAMALSAKGWALMFLGDVEQALSLGKEALELAETVGNRREIAYSCVLLGGAYRVRRDFEQSVAAIERALGNFRALGDRIWEGLMLHNLGQTSRLRGNYAAAKRYYAEAARIANEIGDRYGEMNSLSRLGRIARLREDFGQAEIYFRRALALAERSDNKGRRAYLAHELGELCLAGTTDEALADAERWFEQSLRLAREAQQVVTNAVARAGLARVALAAGRAAAAEEHACAALEIAVRQVEVQGVAARKVVGMVWWVLGQIAARQGNPVHVAGTPYTATGCFAESMHTFDEIGSGVDWERARTLQTWGEYLRDRGSKTVGPILIEEAAFLYGRSGVGDIQDES